MRALCLCDKIISIQNQTHVLILQDKNEFRHPKNTAKILNLSLKNSTLYCDDTFDSYLSKVEDLDRYLLVFSTKYINPKASTTIISENDLVLSCNKYKGIILIDGTWDKAKKIYFEHKDLQQLDHFELNSRVNQYKIRKSPSKYALSTFEAGYFTLALLNEKNIDKIYNIFKTLIKMSLSN